MSNFSFLQSAFPDIYAVAADAEKYVSGDPRTACFHARRSLEEIVSWLYDNDNRYHYPYDTTLSAMMRGDSFERHVPHPIKNKAQAIRRLGNSAVHDNRDISTNSALTIVQELFQITYWLTRTYGSPENIAALPDGFDVKKLPPSQAVLRKNTTAVLKQYAQKLADQEDALRQERARAAKMEEENAALKAKLADQATIAQTRVANEKVPDTHNYTPNEAQTRRLYIDILLREAGWLVPENETADMVPGGVSSEYKVTGMPPQKGGKGNGYADYVLWGDDGLPLAVIEAKKTTRDPQVGKQQAKLYADCLQAMHGRRPIIFFTNGFETYLWDSGQYPERQVQGFYTKDELAWLIQRRGTKLPLDDVATNKNIVDRYYQEEAIRYFAKTLESQRRKGLFVMATGTGKTRTAIATVDVLMRANWVKRVLFLADRTSLVKQAIKAFKKHLPHSNPINLVEDKAAAESRIVVSTYPTMLNQIDKKDSNGKALFSIGHFDLVVIDEAHRSVYQKFGAIFDYFDSFLLGLTATPKSEVDRNTYNLFELEDKVPTYAYDIDQGVADGHLVPPNAVHVPTTFTRGGIKYDDLSEEEQEQWDLLEWGDDGEMPDEISSAAINKWLFNEATVDAVLQNLMMFGLKVAGGDRLGKTIIFAKNQEHANYISKRFNHHYPEYKGDFAAVITSQVEYAQSLIEQFEEQEKAPHIAISVDMLDTGIDVPPVVNLVFFKLVRSKTKFFQMIGRGTRLMPDLFGPDQDKEFFYIFDHCQNFEFFNEYPDGVKTSVPVPLSQRLFVSRLNLLAKLKPLVARNPEGEEADLVNQVRDLLAEQVTSLNAENFIIRPKREFVERYASRNKWDRLTQVDMADLENHIAPLPMPSQDDPESAKRFDSLILQLQLNLTEKPAVFKKLQSRLISIAEGLEETLAIPSIAAQRGLIFQLQEEDFWATMSLKRLELIRLALRDLVGLIEKKKRKTLFTQFADEVHLLGETGPIYEFNSSDLAQYRKKIEHFIKENGDVMAIYKIRHAIPLDGQDVETLEAFFYAADPVGSKEEFERVYGERQNLALFIRKLTGLSRKAAKEKFSRYLDDKTFTADQITFVGYIIDQLTQKGVVSVGELYDRPFTDLHSQGIDGVFDDSKSADQLIGLIKEVNQVAL